MAHNWQSRVGSANRYRTAIESQLLIRESRTVPTYQYACTNPEGKHEFEVVQSFTDAPVSVCPECGSPVRKVYGSVGVVFKGSGFYRTDSRKAARASETASTKASTDSSAASKPAAGSSSSSPSSSSAASAPSAGSSSTSSGSGSKAAN
jgi:putative FmdB family regulatory protein